MRKILYVIFFSFFLVFAESVYAAEVHIVGNRVIVKDDDGNVVDTDNLPKGEEVKTDENVEINDDGISIGSVKNEGGEMKNVSRSTKLENVTIINNGKVKTYNKKD